MDRIEPIRKNEKSIPDYLLRTTEQLDFQLKELERQIRSLEKDKEKLEERIRTLEEGVAASGV